MAATRDLSVRADPGDAPTEVASVTRSLNVMLARLEETAANERAALDASRSFAASVTHELRTPLTSLHTNLDLLRHPTLPVGEGAQVLDEARRAALRMTALLGALEVLARGDLLDDARRERVDLPALVDAAVEEARRRHPHVHITVRAGTEAPEVRGWPEGLGVLVDNLLETAVVHGARGAMPAQVEVTVSARDETVVLAEADRQRVLDPFERGTATSAPGSGLGLAIVSQQVRLHHGTLTLGDSNRGGTCVTVTLPASGQDPHALT